MSSKSDKDMMVEDEASSPQAEDDFEVNYVAEEQQPQINEESMNELDKLNRREQEKQMFIQGLKEQNKEVDKSMDSVLLRTICCSDTLN